MSEIIGKKTSSLNSRKIDPNLSNFDSLDEDVLLQLFKYSFNDTLSLSIVNKKMRKFVGPLLMSYIIDAFQFLLPKSEVTPEFLSAFCLRGEEPHTSLKKIYSQFMPDLEISKFLRHKLIIPRYYGVLAPIIKRQLERTVRTEDENCQYINTKLIIENSIRSNYVDYVDNTMHALGPSFKEFCNFIDCIYGIYRKRWLRNFGNLTIFSFELPYVPKILINQNMAFFYYFIDKRIFLAGFYSDLVKFQSQSQSPEIIFDTLRKELKIAFVLRNLNSVLAISVALLFHYFEIYRNFYFTSLLIFSNFIEFISTIITFSFPNPTIWYYVYFWIILFPTYLLKNNSYLILMTLLLMHFKSGMDSSSSA